VQTDIEDSAAELATVVVTRICHDVAGLLSALSGTLELAAEDPEAAELANETAASLVARVQLLRAAWGGGAGPLDAAAIAAFAQGLPGIERRRLDLADLKGELDEVPARLALCLLLAAVPGAPHGGCIRIANAARGGVHITLLGVGAAWPEALAQCVATRAAWRKATQPRTLPAPLACRLAAQAGWRITLDGATATAVPA
jgi:histidine phosphotransferase ChpT